jgi:fructose-bisphosphate aldolase class II
MLCNYLDIIKRAQREGWAIGAFNTSNLEITQGIIEAAEELQSPVIVNASEKAIEYAGLQELTAIVATLAANVRIPVVLNLDHGRSYEIAERCLAAGFTSLMRDGSALAFDENVKETMRVVDLGHRGNIGVEGEIGAIMGKEDFIEGSAEMVYTDPDKARAFIEATHVDLLAVAVGTAHGRIKGEKLNPEVLKRIRDAVNGTPLVLHGASGTPPDDIKKAISLGVVKINIDTDLRYAFSEALRKNLRDDASVYDPRGILGPAKDAIKRAVKEKIILFGSHGKAT